MGLVPCVSERLNRTGVGKSTGETGDGVPPRDLTGTVGAARDGVSAALPVEDSSRMSPRALVPKISLGVHRVAELLVALQFPVEGVRGQ